MLPFLPTSLRKSSGTCAGDDESCVTRWKIIFSAILFLEGMLFSHGVYLAKRLSKGSHARLIHRLFHFGNALSAGLFLATGLLHIFPEAIHMFEDGLNGGNEEGHEDEDHEDEDHEDEDHEDEDHEDEDEGLLLRQEEDGHDDDHDDSHGDGRFPWSFFVVLLSFYALFFIERIFIPKIMARTGSKSDTSAKEEKLENGEEETDFLLDHSMERPTEGFTSSAFLIGLVQVLGLTVHSAIESIVLGLSPRFSVVLNIFIATLSHRWATSMALAIKLVQQLNYLPFLVLFVIFSLAVPAGVGIGIALTSLSLITQGVLFSISAGTFIYIGAYENMVEEFVLHKPWMFRKFIVMLAGAAIICVITAILVAKDVHG